MKCWISLLGLFVSSAALAQTPTPAQMGITPTTSPEVLQTLDKTQTWVPIGTINSSTHTFQPAGAVAGTGTVSSGTAGQLGYYSANGTVISGASGATVKSPGTIQGDLFYQTNTPITMVAQAPTSSGSILTGMPNVASLVIGYTVADTTHPSAIPAGTFIYSLSNGVQLNNAVQSGGVQTGDSLVFTSSFGYPCWNQAAGLGTGSAGANSAVGIFFDKQCSSFGWYFKYLGYQRGYGFGTLYGDVMYFNNGYDGGSYIPGQVQSVEFPVGFSLASSGHTNINQERWFDSGTAAQAFSINVLQAANTTWTIGATTIATSSNFYCSQITAGYFLIDASLPGGLLPGNVIGQVASCDTGTGIVTLAAPGATKASVGHYDALIGAVQATYPWPATATTIPLTSCQGISGDSNIAINDIMFSPGDPVLGGVGNTLCNTQIYLTTTASVGAKGNNDNLLFGVSATTIWSTSDNQIGVGTCTGIVSPQVMVDMNLTGLLPIGTVSTCANNVLGLQANAAQASAGATDAMVFAMQATASWAIGDPSIHVTNCPFSLPIYWNLVDITIATHPLVTDNQGCASPTVMNLGYGATIASQGAADRLVVSAPAYQAWTTSDTIIDFYYGNASACSQAVVGQALVDLSKTSGVSVIGIVSSCVFNTAIGDGMPQITLTAPANFASVGASDNLAFADAAAGAFTTSTKFISMSQCAGVILGPGAYNASLSGLPFIGSGLCGGKITLTGNAANASSGLGDGLVPTILATGSWIGGALTIGLSSCVGIANPQYLVDMTISGTKLIGQISGCSGGIATLVAGAAAASAGANDELAISTQSARQPGITVIPTGGNFAWSNMSQSFAVPVCAGANAGNVVFDQSLANVVLGTIGVCGPAFNMTSQTSQASYIAQHNATPPGVLGGTLDYLVYSNRRQGDYRLNQNAGPGGYAGWVSTQAGVIQDAFGPVANDTAGQSWTLGNLAQIKPLYVGGDGTLSNGYLGPCNATRAGTFSTISNGIASPTFHQLVGTAPAGAAIQPVFCDGTNWMYH